MTIENLLNSHLPLIKSIAVKYAGFGVPLDDLIQEGMIGLLEAQQRFDESKGASFATYATYWIKKRILHALDEDGHASLHSGELKEDLTAAPALPKSQTKELRLPASMPETEKEVLQMLYIEELTLREIADKKGLTRERVRQIKEKALRRLRAQKTGISPR